MAESWQKDEGGCRKGGCRMFAYTYIQHSPVLTQGMVILHNMAISFSVVNTYFKIKSRHRKTFLIKKRKQQKMLPPPPPSLLKHQSKHHVIIYAHIETHIHFISTNPVNVDSAQVAL